ncbi:MAG: hypothetical protein IT484_00915 [Gammaproteobacteria bacterium]|nr:hypothetical protein [Gammaproteobacteria bacterium]
MATMQTEVVDLTREEFRAALQRSYDLGKARMRAEMRQKLIPWRLAGVAMVCAAPVAVLIAWVLS